MNYTLKYQSPAIMKGFFLFIRAIISGGIATTVHFIVLILCIEYQLTSPLHATMIGWSGGFLINYPLQRYWTFNVNGSHKRFFSRYIISSSLIFILNAVFFSLMTLEISLLALQHLPFPSQFITQPKNLNYFYAQLVTTGLTFLSSFILNHYYTFQESL